MSTRECWFLPNIQCCTLKFLIQIIKSEKLYYMQTNIKQMYIPQWEELAVKYVWAEAMMHHSFKHYLPDHWSPSNHQVDRGFFFAILGSVCPEYVNGLISDCRIQRKLRRQQPKAAQSIKSINPMMLRMLLKHDFVSGKYYS